MHLVGRHAHPDVRHRVLNSAARVREHAALGGHPLGHAPCGRHLQEALVDLLNDYIQVKSSQTSAFLLATTTDQLPHPVSSFQLSTTM